MACIFFGMGCSLLPLFIKVIVAKKFEINVRFVATIVGYAKMKLQKVTSKNRIIFGFFRCGGFWVVGWWFWRGCGVVFIAILPYHCIAVSRYCRLCGYLRGKRIGQTHKSLHIVNEILDADIGFCAKNADRAHQLTAHRPLPPEYVFYPRPYFWPASVGVLFCLG